MSPDNKTLGERLRTMDWNEVEHSLSELGYAKTRALLTADECDKLAALYGDDTLFRSTIEMERYRFGVGEYRYFRYPLPPLVSEFRTHAYSYLAPIANRWAEALKRSVQFPRSLRDFLGACHERQQTRPTPLLLRYATGGYNCLHQDIYGDIAFPLQLACFLSRPEVDYGGGAFLLVEQRPRNQSRGEAIVPGQGEMVVFPNSWRPVPGRRGYYRVTMRHGTSRLTWGSRYTLGIIFHDAK